MFHRPPGSASPVSHPQYSFEHLLIPLLEQTEHNPAILLPAPLAVADLLLFAHQVTDTILFQSLLQRRCSDRYLTDIYRGLPSFPPFYHDKIQRTYVRSRILPTHSRYFRNATELHRTVPIRSIVTEASCALFYRQWTTNYARTSQ